MTAVLEWHIGSTLSSLNASINASRKHLLGGFTYSVGSDTRHFHVGWAFAQRFIHNGVGSNVSDIRTSKWISMCRIYTIIFILTRTINYCSFSVKSLLQNVCIPFKRCNIIPSSINV